MEKITCAIPVILHALHAREVLQVSAFFAFQVSSIRMDNAFHNALKITESILTIKYLNNLPKKKKKKNI